MSYEGSLAFCMSKSAFFVGPVMEHRWVLDKKVQSRGNRVARICTLPKGCYCSAP